MTFTQGVALGCFVVAPSGRYSMRFQVRLRSISHVWTILLFALVPQLFAASSPLADAAEKSDRATIRTLLKQHADVNASQADGMTGLVNEAEGLTIEHQI